MTHEDVCKEELTKAQQGMAMVVNDLRAAFSSAPSAERGLFAPLVEQAQKLSQDIEQLAIDRSC